MKHISENILRNTIRQECKKIGWRRLAERKHGGINFNYNMREIITEQKNNEKNEKK